MSYGCKDRQPFKSHMVVQDGWIVNDNFTRFPRMVAVPFRMAKDCRYQADDKYADPQCVDCKHKVSSTKETA